MVCSGESLSILEYIAEQNSDCSAWNEIDGMVCDESGFPDSDSGGIQILFSGAGHKAADLSNSGDSYDITNAEGIVQVSGSVFIGAIRYIFCKEQGSVLY